MNFTHKMKKILWEEMLRLCHASMLLAGIQCHIWLRRVGVARREGEGRAPRTT